MAGKGGDPRAAATIASATPVLPEVGSTSVVLPGVISPRFSAASIIASLACPARPAHESRGESRVAGRGRAARGATRCGP
jgi:hypothetical protein